MLNRRELLAALGAGAASGLLPALGCGGAVGGPRRPTRRALDEGALEDWLRAAVEDLRVEFPAARARAVIARRATATIDLRGRGVVRGEHVAVVLSATDAQGRVTERAGGVLTAEAIAALVAMLRRSTTPGRDVGLGPAVRAGDRAFDPIARDDGAWLDRVAAVAALADPVATSRVVYRGAWVDTDDAVIWHVASGPGVAAVRRQRLVRSRAGLVLMSWAGSEPMLGVVERGVAGAPEAIQITGGDIAALGRGALELTSPGAVTAGPATVVLMPSVVARIAETAIAPLFTADAWRRPDLAPRTLAGRTVGAPAVTIRAEPGPSHYGGYHFDDEGNPGAAAPLIDGGVVVGPVGAGLAAGHTGPIEAAIGHLAWTPAAGGGDLQALIEPLDDAWIADEGGAAHVDPATWTVTVELGRAREVKRGAESGRLHAAAELTARVPDLLAAVTATTAATETFVRRDGGALDARWRSLAVPAIVSRASLAPRRPA